MRLAPNPLKKRSWVLHYKRNSIFEKQLGLRFSVLKQLLWKEASSESFAVFFFQLAGIIPHHPAMIFALSLQCPDDKQAEKMVIDYLKAVNLLSYLDRIGKYAPKIVYFQPTWTVPCGHIHIFDLTQNELNRLFWEADKKHGAAKRLGAVLSADIPSQMNEKLRCKKPELHPHYQKLLKLKEWLTVAAMAQTPGHADEVKRKIERLFTPRFCAILLGNAEHLSEQMKQVIPQNFIFESESRKSLAHSTQEKAFQALTVSDLSRDCNNTMHLAFRKKELAYYSKLPLPQKNKKTSPDTVHAAYSSYKHAIKEARMITSKYRNEGVAYAAYFEKAKEPTISAAEFTEMFSSDKQALRTLALNFTSAKLKIGRAYCETLQKEGSKSAMINARWKDYFNSLLLKIQKAIVSSTPK
ncbi:MAG: hypothetical protein PHP45_03360 [Elusimicrobiales bacterium]|nr:hypothetical protein [Elusimicrobiales bacterium]